ncbi:MAG: hypothetical protein ACTTJC_01440 [Campylobacter sp.]
MLFNTKTKEFIYDNYIVTPEGTFFLDMLSKKELKKLGIEEKELPLPPKEKPRELSEEEKMTALKAEFLSNVDEILNQEARKKGYDSIVTAVSYAGYENSFQAEGIKFGKWRSQVYEWGYALLKEIESGKRSLPQSFEEIKNDMPKFK